MSLRDRWAAAWSGWSGGDVPTTLPLRSRRIRRGAAMPSFVQLRRRTVLQQSRELTPANRHDWRATTATAVAIVTVALVASGQFYTNSANRKQQELALQGQIADRFTAAMGQLGQEDEPKQSRLELRLGGIYALQRLMVDSPRDEKAVVEVLCAFVRSHAPRPTVTPATVPQAAVDIRSAIAVLGKRPKPAEYPLDFAGALLGLSYMDLTDASLNLVALTDADLTNAVLRGAQLQRASLTGADLSMADIDGASMQLGTLEHAYFTRANMRGANLTDAKLFDAHMFDADMTGAKLSRVDLSQASMQTAHLSGADLTGADLTEADMTRADLTGANLRSANLDGTYLNDANLSGADLSAVGGLTAEQLSTAKLDEETKLPPGLRRPVISPSR